MFQAKFIDKTKTHFMLNNIFSENRAIYEIMGKNIVEPDRPQCGAENMLFSCQITEAKLQTHSPNI
jgi:hypothetical protein